MTDDLLDEATRLADGNVGPRSAVVMRALVERVREAEAKCAQYRADTVRAERAEDEARAKLDAVRAAASEESECLLHPDDDPVQCGWKQTVRRVLAIIDAEGSTRPQEATGG